LGKRNISSINLCIIANAFGIRLSELFVGFPADKSPRDDQFEPCYKAKINFSIYCGFSVTSDDVAYAAKTTSNQLQELPLTLFQSIDLKTLSGITSSLFSNHLAKRVGAIVNPIEKGHPDIIPVSGSNSSEEQLRNYPEGLEVKCTVGNIEKVSNLQIGEKRLLRLTSLTWQAHHREVERLLGLVIDFAGKIVEDKHFPIITAAFYADDLKLEDWGKISGTTGRSTKVTGMRASGRFKMGSGWVIIIDEKDYRQKYGSILSFSV